MVQNMVCAHPGLGSENWDALTALGSLPELTQFLNDPQVLALFITSALKLKLYLENYFNNGYSYANSSRCFLTG